MKEINQDSLRWSEVKKGFQENYKFLQKQLA